MVKRLVLFGLVLSIALAESGQAQLDELTAYRSRQQVSDALQAMSDIKLEVYLAYTTKLAFPDENQAKHIMSGIKQDNSKYSIALAPNTGVIAIQFSESSVSVLKGKSVYLKPRFQDDMLDGFTCLSDEIDNFYLPYGCRW